jgi:L-iditol 2-dehydrogenase
MAGRMKAAVFYGGKEDCKIEEVSTPKVGEGDVLLKVKACGICGSDARYFFNGNEPRYKKPVILGHEITADIAEVGSKVKEYIKGNRVTVAPIYGCGQCEFCITGQENLCEEVVVFGINTDAGFAEYMLIPEKGVKRGVLIKLDDKVSDKAGTILESLSCVLHGQRKLDIQPGDSVVIFGAGPIGLLHLLVSKKIGAGKVIVVDIVEERLKEAKKIGADHIVNSSNKTWENEIYSYLGKNGTDRAISAAPSLAAVEDSFKVIKKGGKVLIFGGIPKGNTLAMDPNFIHYNEVEILGSVDATIDDFKRTVALAPYFDLDRFISYSYKLEDIKKGMDRIKNKEGIKTIIKIN